MVAKSKSCSSHWTMVQRAAERSSLPRGFWRRFAKHVVRVCARAAFKTRERPAGQKQRNNNKTDNEKRRTFLFRFPRIHTYIVLQLVFLILYFFFLFDIFFCFWNYSIQLYYIYDLYHKVELCIFVSRVEANCQAMLCDTWQDTWKHGNSDLFIQW